MSSSLKDQWKRGKSSLVKRIKYFVLVRYKLLQKLSQNLKKLLIRHGEINSLRFQSILQCIQTAA